MSGSPNTLIKDIAASAKKQFTENKYLLTFSEYLELFYKKPDLLSRNAAEYTMDMMLASGFRSDTKTNSPTSFGVFSKARAHKQPPIVGQDEAHSQIFRILEQFVRQGRVDKLILLHGPNGSSKSSTIQAMASGLEDYSATPDGAIYKFNWIFPTDKIGYDGLGELSNEKRIGFEDKSPSRSSRSSFAHLPDEQILCKIPSELRENPMYLLPKDDRYSVYLAACSALGITGKPMPSHLQDNELSSKNSAIFGALKIAYQGDLEKILQHIQVERFFFSARYRVGIATVEPQMSIDANERQLTMERNLQNLPPVLQNIRLFEPNGDLVDANRGLIEYSDLLKRPIEAYKYLLTTTETMSLQLGSGSADLDTIMLASSNEKHLDAFKSAPDWPSFKGRFELIRVPYLLNSHLESQIYSEDVKLISQSKPIAPHTLQLLAKWAVLTRLRQPNPDNYPFPSRSLINRLNPYEKIALYDGDATSAEFSANELSAIKKLLPDIKLESCRSTAYEGRFGASPREMKMLLYFASQNKKYDSVNAIAIFEELEALTRDRSVYDYLQFEPASGYHDVIEFNEFLKNSYARSFTREFLSALNLFDDTQYLKAMERYLRLAIAHLNNEKVQNEQTGKQETPQESILVEMESMLGCTSDRKQFREHMVSKLASWRVDFPTDTLDVSKIFDEELQKIAKKIYEDKLVTINEIKDSMLTYGTPDYDKLSSENREKCNTTFENLKTKFGYTYNTTWNSIVFLRSL